MLVQIGFESKGFTATLARKRFQIGMSLNVGAQIGFVGKSLFADLTGKRFFTYEKHLEIQLALSLVLH